jgi:hypothetical protein
MGVLLQEFGDERLEGIEFAGARTVDRGGHRSLEIFFDGAGGQVELAGDAAHRPMLAARKTMNFVDLVNLQHACGYKPASGAMPEGCSLQAAWGALRERLTG